MKSFIVSQLMSIIIRISTHTHTHTHIYIYIKMPEEKHLSEITPRVKQLLREVLVSTQP
jgi:hypothetical protein